MTADNSEAIANDQDDNESVSKKINNSEDISQHIAVTQEQSDVAISSEGETLHFTAQFISNSPEALNEHYTSLQTSQAIEDEIPETTELPQDMEPFHLQSHPQSQNTQEYFTSTSQRSYDPLTAVWNVESPLNQNNQMRINSVEEISNASQYFQRLGYQSMGALSSGRQFRNLRQPQPVFQNSNPFYQGPISQEQNQNNYYTAQPLTNPSGSLSQAFPRPFDFPQPDAGYPQSQQQNPFMPQQSNIGRQQLMHQQSNMRPQQPMHQQPNMTPQQPLHRQPMRRSGLSYQHFSEEQPCGKRRKRQKRNEEYRHKCEACSKPFLRPSALKQHKVVHTHERPFQCPVPHCSRHKKGNWFSVKSNMKRHIKNVHKDIVSEEPCECSTCLDSTESKDEDDEDENGSPPPSDCIKNNGSRYDKSGGSGSGSGLPVT